MKLKIIGYSNIFNYHVCKDEEGKRIFVDILVDGGIKIYEKNKKTIAEDLIGREVECDRITPFISIAHNVKLLKK